MRHPRRPRLLPPVLLAAALCGCAHDTQAPNVDRPDLVRIVRGKISAGDLASAEAWIEDWKRDVGTDETYWNGVGWLARGARMLGESDRALELARTIQEALVEPTEEQLGALGAALETEGLILAERSGSTAAAAYFREATKRSPDTAFRSRMWKNVNRLELVGAPAPEIAVGDGIGGATPTLQSLRGRPVLLFFWAHWCGDCRASVPTLARIVERFAPRGLELIAPTRLYGTGKDNADATPEEERRHMAEVLADKYGALPGLRVPIDSETMVRYGASATPTFVLVDSDGIVRLYAPTRLTESAFAAAIEPWLPTAAP